MSGHEELSFGGGDPDREPWLEARLRTVRERSAACREWARAHVRVLTVCAVVPAVLGAAGFGGLYLYERSREPLPPPDAPLPAQLRFVVYPCGRMMGANCSGGGDAEANARVVAERMRSMPELAEVVPVSEEESRREVLAYYADAGEELPQGMGAGHPVVRARLHRGGDFAEVARRLRGMPEVETVYRELSDFWAGKADLAVRLCGKAMEWQHWDRCAENRSGGAEHPTTAEEKEAILDRIWDLPGAETVYLQSREDSIRLDRHYYPEEPSSSRMFRWDRAVETFYVKLSDPAAFPAAARALKSLPGVGWVSRVGSDG
ncbi:hypothetical protein GCM10010466_05050 [Planomonospora alba]|uniref:FtsX extracellular domain-containing protein n=1 Tax=Planomonospora alba TaxID=161354 RepID=A0ABP6MME4_9ACTN